MSIINSNNKNLNAGFKKVLTGVLFAAACFASVFVLVEFHDIYWLVAIMCVILMAAAFFFLDTLFSEKNDVFDELAKAQEALESTREEERQKADEDFRKKIEEKVAGLDTTSRAMFAAMRKNAEAQEKQFSQMTDKIEKAISAEQASIKTVIKFNKENARQVAESAAQIAVSSKEAIENIKIVVPETAIQTVTSPTYESLVAADFSTSSSDISIDEGFGDISTDFSTDFSTDSPENEEISEIFADSGVSGDIGENSFEDISESDVENITDTILEDFGVESDVPDIPILSDPTLSDTVSEEDPMEGFNIDLPEADAAPENTDEIDLPADISLDGLLDESTEVPTDALPADILADLPADLLGEPDTAPTDELPADILADLPSDLTADETPDIPADIPIEDAPAEELPTEEAPAEEIPVDEAPVQDTASETAPTEEAPKVDTSEDALAAATGIDLSNPNTNLSVEDIAKLFAAAGN